MRTVWRRRIHARWGQHARRGQCLPLAQPSTASRITAGVMPSGAGCTSKTPAPMGLSGQLTAKQNATAAGSSLNTVRLTIFPMGFLRGHRQRLQQLRRQIHFHISQRCSHMTRVRRISSFHHTWVIDAEAARRAVVRRLAQQRLKPPPALSWLRWGERPRTGAGHGATVGRWR